MHLKSAKSTHLSLLVSFLLVFAFSCGGNDDENRPLIFAAASLSDVLTEVVGEYENSTGNSVKFSFGGSITLANQVAQLGAPADGVFLVGDRPVEILRTANKVDGETDSFYTNSLVVVGSRDNDQNIRLDDVVSDPSRLAIADPELAPAGVFAREYFTSAGDWASLENSIIRTLDVRAALATVEPGNADYALVYRTDISNNDSVSVVMELTEGYSPIKYSPLGVQGAKRKADAEQFLEFAVSDQNAVFIFERHGFSLVSNNP